MPPAEEDVKNKPAVTSVTFDEKIWVENNIKSAFKIAEKDLKKLVESDDYR
jgi:hypothetical protein